MRQMTGNDFLEEKLQSARAAIESLRAELETLRAANAKYRQDTIEECAKEADHWQEIAVRRGDNAHACGHYIAGAIRALSEAVGDPGDIKRGNAEMHRPDSKVMYE